MALTLSGSHTVSGADRLPISSLSGFVSQGLDLLSGPRSSSITRRAAGFPMLFLCILVGEDSTRSRPLLAHCIQTLLVLANTPLPQNWDQTLDLPQVKNLTDSAGKPCFSNIS